MIFFGTIVLYSFIYLNLHLRFQGAKLFFVLNLILLAAILFQKPKIVSSRINLALLLLLGVMILSVPFSSYIRVSFEFLVYLIKMALIAFVTYYVLNSTKKLSTFLWIWLAYQFFIAKNAMTAFNVSDSAIRYGATGLTSASFLGDANDFALALNIALPFGFYLMLQTKNKIVKGLLAVEIIFFIIGIVISHSRGGFITLILTLAFMLYQGKKRLTGLAMVAIVIVGIFVLSPPSYVERMDTITGSALEQGETGYGRLTLWKAGLKMMMNHPLTGVGLVQYRFAWGTEYHPEWDRKWKLAHNSYVTMGAETGIAGFLLYFYLLYTIFKENYDIRKGLKKAQMKDHLAYSLSKALTASLAAYCVGTMFLTAHYYIHIYLIMALTLAIKRIMVEEYGFEIQNNKERNLIKAQIVTN